MGFAATLKRTIPEARKEFSRVNWRKSPTMWKENFKYAAKDTFNTVASVPANFMQRSLTQKFHQVTFAAGLVGFSALVFMNNSSADSMWLWVAEGVGLIGTLGIKASGRLKFVKHRLAMDPAISPLVIPQAIMHGGINYAIMMGIKAGRSAILSNIPEEHKNLRRLTGIFSWAGGITCMAILVPKNSLWEIVPAISMTLGTMSDLVPSSKSRYSRFMHFAGNLLNLSYGSIYMNSFSSTLGHTLNLQNLLMNGIVAHDLPEQDEDGRKLGSIERWKIYAKNMAKGTPTKPEKPQPAGP